MNGLLGAGVAASQVIPLIGVSKPESTNDFLHAHQPQKFWIDPRFARFPVGLEHD